MTHKETALALIEAAAFIARRRDESEYWSISVQYSGVVISQYMYENSGSYDYVTETYPVKMSAAENMAAMRKSLGGHWEKEVTEYAFSLEHKLTEGVTLKLIVSREEACEPKVIGTETVEVKDYDNCPVKTITRDIIEYDCKPILS